MSKNDNNKVYINNYIIISNKWGWRSKLAEAIKNFPPVRLLDTSHVGVMEVSVSRKLITVTKTWDTFMRCYGGAIGKVEVHERKRGWRKLIHDNIMQLPTKDMSILATNIARVLVIQVSRTRVRITWNLREM